MLDKKYYEGYEGEEQIKIWCEEGREENGFLIWNGFFNMILEGCFKPEFPKGGIIECYYNHDGFYDEKWEMNFPHIVLDELKTFDENVLETKNQGIVETAKEIVEKLIRAEGFIPRRLRRNKGDETRLQLPYENNIPRCLRRGMLISFIDTAISKNAKVYIEYE